jgi:hypothetical protein
MADSYSNPADKKKDTSSMFGGSGKKDEKYTGPSASDLLEHINSIDRRLRTLESRYNDLNRKLQFMEKNNAAEKKRIFADIKVGDDINLQQKKEIGDLQDTMRRVIAEFKNFAAVEDVNALKKYIELWEPVNFVTHNEVEELVDEKVKEANAAKKKKIE